MFLLLEELVRGPISVAHAANAEIPSEIPKPKFQVDAARRVLSSEGSQAKDSKRTILTESSRAKDLNSSSQTKDPRGTSSSDSFQAKAQSGRSNVSFLNDGPEVNVAKRTFPSERSQAKVPQSESSQAGKPNESSWAKWPNG